jgi:hypothetical protein
MLLGFGLSSAERQRSTELTPRAGIEAPGQQSLH